MALAALIKNGSNELVTKDQMQVFSDAVEKDIKAAKAATQEVAEMGNFQWNLFQGSWNFSGFDLGKATTEAVTGTEIPWAVCNGSDAGFYDSLLYTFYNSAIKPNTDYVYSFEAMGAAETTITAHLYDNADGGVVSNVLTSQGYTSTAADGHADFKLTKSFTKYWVRWRTKSTVPATVNFIGVRTTSGDTTVVYVRAPKLEEDRQYPSPYIGTRAETYSPFHPNTVFGEWDTNQRSATEDVGKYIPFAKIAKKTINGYHTYNNRAGIIAVLPIYPKGVGSCLLHYNIRFDAAGSSNIYVFAKTSVVNSSNPVLVITDSLETDYYTMCVKIQNQYEHVWFRELIFGNENPSTFDYLIKIKGATAVSLTDSQILATATEAS